MTNMYRGQRQKQVLRLRSVAKATSLRSGWRWKFCSPARYR